MNEWLDDYLKIHLPARSRVVARMTIKALLAELPENDFIRVHRSFIVPLSRIQAMKKNN